MNIRNFEIRLKVVSSLLWMTLELLSGRISLVYGQMVRIILELISINDLRHYIIMMMISNLDLVLRFPYIYSDINDNIYPYLNPISNPRRSYTIMRRKESYI